MDRPHGNGGAARGVQAARPDARAVPRRSLSADQADSQTAGRGAARCVAPLDPCGGGDMKVVLFCGGLGMRIRESGDDIPKPMVTIGYRPILWHLMKYYAHYGHTEFILCLGYRGDLIKQYFLDYDECLSNDFELAGGSKTVKLYGRDIDGWKITFADTGLHANIG